VTRIVSPRLKLASATLANDLARALPSAPGSELTPVAGGRAMIDAMPSGHAGATDVADAIRSSGWRAPRHHDVVAQRISSRHTWQCRPGWHSGCWKDVLERISVTSARFSAKSTTARVTDGRLSMRSAPAPGGDGVRARRGRRAAERRGDRRPMAATNKCLAQSNKSRPPSKATNRRNAMNEYRQGSAPVGRAVSKARAGRCWASRTDEPAHTVEQLQ
jgi:hypothetical protein